MLQEMLINFSAGGPTRGRRDCPCCCGCCDGGSADEESRFVLPSSSGGDDGDDGDDERPLARPIDSDDGGCGGCCCCCCGGGGGGGGGDSQACLAAAPAVTPATIRSCSDSVRLWFTRSERLLAEKKQIDCTRSMFYKQCCQEMKNSQKEIEQSLHNHNFQLWYTHGKAPMAKVQYQEGH